MARDDISTRQQEILDLIFHTVNDRGYPPSVREIGDAVGLSSPSTVHSHLSALVKAGYLRRDPTKPRAIEVIEEGGLIVDAVIEANPSQVAEYRAGKDKLLGFFVGQVMKETRGKANPSQVNVAIKRRLDD